MSRDDLLEAWVAEAKHVLKTQEDLEDGLCVWKSVGKREVCVSLYFSLLLFILVGTSSFLLVLFSI